MAKNDSLIVSHHASVIGLKSYVIGFISSLILTMISYLSVVNHLFSYSWLEAFILFIAVVQFIVQLIYFLHLGKENKPKYRLLMFSFMIMVVLLIVVGSIWIMANLNYRMTPKQMNNYMLNQNGGL